MARVIWGFAIAPLMVPLFFLLHAALAVEKPRLQDLAENALGFLVLVGPYSYLVAFMFGVPVYLFMRLKNWVSLPAFLISGGFLGTLTVLILLPGERARVLDGLISGALSATCFWYIAVRERTA
ncbi:MAG: hypothetical protein E8D41_09380 [Nitrospira sp.]|nr:MAG: hypothetical protein E8D41_09380 [Nitrospira sp.]